MGMMSALILMLVLSLLFSMIFKTEGDAAKNLISVAKRSPK